MRSVFAAGLAMWSCLALACGSKSDKPTRAECTQAAEHIADLIIQTYTANPETWFDAVSAEQGDTGLPKDVDRTTFKAFLASPPGQTWLLQRRGNTLSGVQQGIDPCVEHATRPQVKCLIAAKSKDEVLACDEKFGPKPSPGSAAGSANDSAKGSGATGSGSAEIK